MSEEIETVVLGEPSWDLQPHYGDDYDACETLPWPAHEEGLRELEDNSPQPASVWTARTIWAAAVVMFIADGFAYFTR